MENISIKVKTVILLSTYNGEKYLREQLDTILNQAYQNFTLIIRDDGSFDSTPKIIKEYEKNSSNLKKVFLDQSYSLYKEYPDNYISVQGVMNEIARQKHMEIPYLSNAFEVANYTHFGHLEFTKQAFKKWIESVKNTSKKYNIHLKSLFHMEQRIGRWNATIRSDWNIVQDIFEMWNTRDFI